MARGEVSTFNSQLLLSGRPSLDVKSYQKEGGALYSTGSKNNELCNATIQSLRRFVGALLQLTVVGCLLDEVQNGLREGRVGDGPSWVEVLVESLTIRKIAYRQRFDRP